MHEQLLLPVLTAPHPLRLELTRECLARLSTLATDLIAHQVRAVTLVLPVPEPIPAAFRNGTPARADVPAVLDAVAPVRRFRDHLRGAGVEIRIEGFPPGIFDGNTPPLPVTAMIEVSSRCNLRCPLCSVGRRALPRWNDMPLATFARIVRRLAPAVRRLALHNLGEPLLHRELPELVRVARAAGIPAVFLSTNLAVEVPERVRALAESGVREIVCSLDAGTAATYPVYRVGGDWSTVLANLDTLRAARERLGPAAPRIRLQFLLFRHNLDERTAFRELAHRYQVGYEIKVASAPRGSEHWLPEDAGWHRASRESDHGWCSRPWQHTTVLSDGTVVPCCKDADGAHALGNAAEQDFDEIWGSARFQAFRATMMADKSQISLCRNCPGGWFVGSNVIEHEEDPWPGR